MKDRRRMRIGVAIGAAATMALSLVGLTAIAASADVPDPQVAAPFTAPLCAGQTDFDPANNAGMAVPDTTQVFGERLVSYNEGRIVPLYDGYGGTVLITADGTVTGDAAYPPVCGTRYVASAGKAVSEWMFCTDRDAQSCGDTNAAGSIVDHDGNPINPMTGLPTNPKLSPEQEKLIAFLVQHGHSYVGIGDQDWGVDKARSDLGTSERNALQTLVWCVSDPATSDSGFARTCAANMDADEQARLLAMIPDEPVIDMVLGGTSPVKVGDTAEFQLSTNLFNQPIALQLSGAALTGLSVCEGTATLTGAVLTVTGSDPNVSIDVTLCATATETGSATLEANATPPSTEHIGWAQSINASLEQPCQVYATFHEDDKVAVSARAAVVVEAAPTPTPTPTDTTTPTPTPTDTVTPTPSDSGTPTAVPSTRTKGGLASTGGAVDFGSIWVGLALLAVGGLAVLMSVRRARNRS